MEKLIEGAAD